MPGQAYVALSRLRSLNGLILLSPLRMNGICNDEEVMEYAQNKATDELLKNSLHFETKNFIHNYLINSFEWHELAQEWRNHKYSYNGDTDSPLKSQHSFWANKQFQAMDALLVPSQKFINQLHKIFNTEKEAKKY